ncbi:MAG: alcohol dehydrogenase catalytic domain-containing protein [Clostridiales bacterium]|nr:alcohol dehydrogenase catalytic domain-containing protein [Clostridiales bacterium]
MKTLYLIQSLPRIIALKALAFVSKAAYYSRLSPVVFEKDYPSPALPSSNWVRVRNIQCGICGSDVSLFKCTAGPKSAFEPMPIGGKVFLGHETVGVVTEAGDDVKDLKVGDRVVMMKYTSSCDNKDITPRCRFCEAGEYSMCENYGELSPHDLPLTGAGFGDEYIAPKAQLFKIDDSMSDDDAIFLEPAAVAVHSVLRCPPNTEDKVLVYGTGVIGLCIIQCLKAMYPDCKIYVPVRSKSKGELVTRMGADVAIYGDVYEAVANETGAKLYYGMGNNRMLMGGMDIIYDTLGNARATHDCIRWVRARGSYVKIGYQMNETKYDDTPIWFQELIIIGVSCHGMELYNGEKLSSFELAKRLYDGGTLDFSGLITHRFPLEDYKKAFRTVIEHKSGVIKAVIDCR